MLIIPAIGIRGGKVVRLERGDYAREKPYALMPQEAARQWVEEGAERLHIVDLDGAREGKVVNLAALKEILAAVSVPIEFGGGVREIETISFLLKEGVRDVILGTRAVVDEDFLKSALEKFGTRIIVGVDAKEGDVKVGGWLGDTGKEPIALIKKLASLGAAKIIYTDISRDGVLSGPNLKKTEAILKAIDIPLIASGGVAALDDIKRLKELEALGLFGVIVGKALYEGRIDLKEAIDVAL